MDPASSQAKKIGSFRKAQPTSTAASNTTNSASVAPVSASSGDQQKQHVAFAVPNCPSGSDSPEAQRRTRGAVVVKPETSADAPGRKLPRPLLLQPAQDEQEIWEQEELQKWEEERRRVAEQRKKFRQEKGQWIAREPKTQAAAAGKEGTMMSEEQEKERKIKEMLARLTPNPADLEVKRRTIGVATPHSHFFRDEDEKKDADKKDGGGKRVGPAQPGDKPTPPKSSSPQPADPNRPYTPWEDPTRPLKDVPFPEVRLLTKGEVFKADGKVDAELIKQHMLREGRLAHDLALAIIEKASEIMKNEPNVLNLKPPIAVFGDIHGQYYDLVNILSKAGKLENMNMLFLGDYVDRGTFGCEVVFYLYCLKINYPEKLFMLRGNHESRLLAEHFNFRQECVYKYDEQIYNAIQDSFDCLPLAATIQAQFGKLFCVHGGLSPEIKLAQINDINNVYRFREPPEKGVFCDLLWSDPIDEMTAIGLSGIQLARWHEKTFEQNATRGCSYLYGYKAVREFLDRNGLLCIVRAHEVQKQGYRLHRFRKADLLYPVVITVFSAPNYCDMYENWAAWLVCEDRGYTFGQLAWVDHPYYLPKFANALTFTFPFVVENVMKVLADVLTAIGEIGVTSEEEAQWATEEEAVMRKRVRAMGRIAIMMKKMRMEAENNIKQLETQGGEKFEYALRLDLKNEKRPVDVRKRFKTF